MFDRVNVVNDMNTALGLARSVAPFKTGNLRYNSISAYLTDDGWAVQYSLQNAFYIYFQEEGTRFTTRNQGFIANKTVPLISNFLYSKYATKNMGEVESYNQQATFGNQDIFSKTNNEPMLEERLNRYLFSNFLDLDKISKGYEWQHDASYERPAMDKFAKR
jgi:hypothetical protein